MIELYTIFLFSIGAYLNKNMKEPIEIKTTAPKKGNLENIYNTKIKEKVDELSNKYAEEVKAKMCPQFQRSLLIFLIPELRLYMKKVEKRKQRVPKKKWLIMVKSLLRINWKNQ